MLCTAISLMVRDHYFGRNLDLEYNYHEAVTIAPRNYPFIFRKESDLSRHYAIIGMATVSQNYPLYYDATNEHGLSMAGLNFPDNAVYHQQKQGLDNVAPFELIPWILCQCKNVTEALEIVTHTNPLNIPFNNQFPLSPLHWILSDQKESFTIEPLKNGFHIYENPIGVLTNNPPFEYHLYNLSNYMNITADEPEDRFSKRKILNPYGRGMGGFGLPGDLSSASRFIRACFTKLNSRCAPEEKPAVSQFFHILDSVAQTEGCAKVGNNYEKTLYASCCNTTKGIYYYKTYGNNRITAVQLFHEDLERNDLIQYPLLRQQDIRFEN